jgi:hypothetical protein
MGGGAAVRSVVSMTTAKTSGDDMTGSPTVAFFDLAFSAAAESPGLRRVWELVAPDLPPEVEPFSFVSAALLLHVAQALDLGDPGDDARLAGLQDEARRILPLAGLMHRVVVTAVAPER